MAKTPRKLYKVGELMEFSGLSRQTLQYYSLLGLIKAASRTKAGHRLYDESVFEVIDRIKELRSNNTLEDVRRLLSEEGSATPRAAGT